MPHLSMVHDEDPKAVIARKIGDLSDKAIPYSNILIAIYQRPEKTASGLHLPDNYRDEDKYQGKVGLVMKVGPMAFRDTEGVSFGGFSVKEGDWVVIRASDGWALSVNKVECRMVSDAAIKMVIQNPDDVW